MITIISRASQLAQLQVTELQRLAPTLAIEPRFVRSMGDKDLQTSLMARSVAADFFTRELDRAVLEGEVDCAVHSAKDLPYPLPEGLAVIALTEAGDKRDALVSRDGLTLETLPEGARLGTSSVSRREQLLALRPDLAIVSIRGDIDQRIDYVTRGECDTVVVAACALHRLGYGDQIADYLPIHTHPLQGNLAIVAREDRYDLAAQFRPLDYRRQWGSVLLVGAGPGDPELITRRGERAIREADVVFYDDLLDRELLSWASGELVYVGKRKGEHSLSQPEINELLYGAALAGKSVVRLKCGDPLLFSRGGEEIDYLQERLVRVAVVPGVSSFQGCAAGLNLPVTKRGIARSLTAISGHYEVPAQIPVADGGTHVIFMGATRGELLREAFLGKGWRVDTPLLAISRGTYADEQVRRATVDELGTIALPTPVMLIVGAVTEGALTEPKILFTGLNPARINLPGKVVHLPLIAMEPCEPEEPIAPRRCDGLILTSKAAVEHFFARFTPAEGTTIATVGPATAAEIERFGYRATIIPETYEAAHLLPLLKQSGVEHWLYPCSDRSNSALHKEPNVHAVVLYKTVTREVELIALESFAAIFFSSASTVDAFVQRFGALPAGKSLLVYGEPTKRRLLAHGAAESAIVLWRID